MSTITMTATGLRSFRGPKYSSSASGGARQGWYNGDYKAYSQVGKIYFGTLTEGNTSLSEFPDNVVPQSIIIDTCTFSGAGASRIKRVYFYSTFEEPTSSANSTNIVPSGYIGYADFDKAYNNTETNKTLVIDSNGLSNLITALKRQVLYIYSGETSGTDYANHSNNYLNITAIKISVTYTNAGTVYYKNGSSWVKCYAYYKNGSTWVRCNPYYKNGNTWILGSG